jgi:hypothetical protein
MAELLRCEECGRPGDAAMKVWRGLIGAALDDTPVGEQADVCLLVFCPECAEREFGPSQRGQERPTA